MPKRLQRSRSRGWRMPPNAVYVGRPTDWGNPFTAKAAVSLGFAKDDEEARRVCVDTFRDWLKLGMGIDEDRRRWILENLIELEGRDLVCWCPEGSPCHGDVLMELAEKSRRARLLCET